MTHTDSCERDAPGHVHPEVREVPSALDPPSAAIAERTRRAGRFVALPEVRWAALSLGAFVTAVAVSGLAAPAWVTGVLFSACYLAGGWEPAVAGWQALRERTLDVDLLMIVAALAAAAIGQVLDGALLIVIFATSGALEAVATRRTADSVRDLLTLTPGRATRLHDDGTDEVIDAAALAVDDRVLVRPGERIGADGRVVAGASEVNQATITGEPLPVDKTAGDEVFAGTLNGTGTLTVVVERAGDDTAVARIVRLVEQAAATKARTQLFIERVEQRYSVGVVVATLALLAIPLAAGAAFEATLLRAITFMIVASPCAVVLATMPPLLSAIANAGRRGVLVRSAVVMEQLGATSLVAFDKTGTLTIGEPHVAQVLLLPQAGIDQTRLLELAAAAERPSEHPLGRAIVATIVDRRLPEATGFTAQPGRGVTATVEGHRVRVGSPRLLDDLDHTSRDPVAQRVTDVEQGGATAVVVLVDGIPAGVLAITDQPRTTARAAVAALRRLTGAQPVIITGDREPAARALAANVGISTVHSGLLPEDKVTIVEKYRASDHHVTVVGDGINDAPALAAANVGIAMGQAGSDLTLETADAVIVRDELHVLPALIDLSRTARRLVVQNLVIAAVVIVTLVTWDLTGSLPLPLAVAGHEGSTAVVALNGLRLLSRRHWRAST